MTRTGRRVLGGSGLLYLAGVLLGWPELVGLAAAGFVVLALAGLLVLVPAGLVVRRTVEPDRVVGGVPAVARLEAATRRRLPSRGVVVVDRLADQRVELPVPALPPGGRRTLRYALPTPRRGRLPVGPLTVERRDPLGLVRRAQPLTDDRVLWVRPRVHPLPALPVGTLLETEGPQLENTPHGTVTFSSLREYVAGDDPRLVHWRSTARTGSLMVREHVDTSQPTTTVLVDTRRSTWPADPAAGLDEACEVAASVVSSVSALGRPAALLALGEDTAAAVRSGARDAHDRLAALQVSDGTDEMSALAEWAAPGGALVVVTGHLEPVELARLASQRRRFSPVVLVQLQPGTVTRAERAAGLTIVRASDAATAAAGWRALLRTGRG